MGNLFSCEHCQSVLKWEEGALKVVYESKEDPVAPVVQEEKKKSALPAGEALSSNESAWMKEKPELEELQESEKSPIGEDILPELTAAPEKVPEDFEVIKESPPEDRHKTSEGLMPEPVTEESPKEELMVEQAEAEGSSGLLKEFSEQDQQIKPQTEWAQEKEEETARTRSVEKKEIWDREKSSSGMNQDFSDVADYGNAQASSEKGFLRYNLRIVGLDSVEIEQEILSVLEDPRFNWNAKEILKSQKEGVLEIKNLNPIKAMCLVSELSFLSVGLSWSQSMALNAQSERELEKKDPETGG